MKIRVFDKIDDPFLRLEWERLEQENNIFPQNSYHWCSTWWKHLRGRRKLHVVMALDTHGKGVSIAPLCVERNFGVRVLRSFPIHFGDFYVFIGANGHEKAVTCILEYIESNRSWSWVRLEQVISSSELAQVLAKRGFCRKKMTGSVIASFAGLDWDEYLGMLVSSFRRNVRNRQRKIDSCFIANLKIINDWESFANEFERMQSMHEKRWADDNTPHKSNSEIECWREALKEQFEKGRAVFYQLIFSEKVVAYRLGFISAETYYDWHTSFDPDYRNYHVGQMSIAFMIKRFMKDNIGKINFMAGEYDWKLDWSSDREVIPHYMYSSPSNNFFAKILNWYHHSLRDQLKAKYHCMMKNSFLRAISRVVISARQRLAGQK